MTISPQESLQESLQASRQASSHQFSAKTLTGRHMLIMVVSAFAIVIAANLTLAFFAVATFPGVEAKNSYVASQSFNARHDQHQALGWQVDLLYQQSDTKPETGQGQLRLHFTDQQNNTVIPVDVHLRVGAATHAGHDQTFVLQHNAADGVFQDNIDLPPGNWVVYITATSASGIRFQQRRGIIVNALTQAAKP